MPLARTIAPPPAISPNNPNFQPRVSQRCAAIGKLPVKCDRSAIPNQFVPQSQCRSNKDGWDVLYRLTIELYRLTIELYRLTIKLYRLTIELYRLTIELYWLTIELYWLTIELQRLTLAIRPFNIKLQPHTQVLSYLTIQL
ncbi:hypothetical protein K9N68_29250 [Kovacikia minuta CCNUW1]|uniref:hypothetical protein n=1 Tax=Kovacikia minuta TaxID=2931930 RepID=UPI001CCAA853|nr:hypothetical protein [Kovacikia minuta]UBF25611.1 hypothetical protein K9N68_29250 [Kovacikia minuta CCNUW1]